MAVGDRVYFFVAKISSTMFFYDLQLLNPLIDYNDNEPLKELFGISVRHIATSKDELKSIVEQHLERIKVQLNHDIDILEDL